MDPEEAEILFSTMDHADLKDLTYIIYEIKDEMIDSWMEVYGTPHADALIDELLQK